MALFNFRRKGGSGKGTVIETHPSHILPAPPGLGSPSMARELPAPPGLAPATEKPAAPKKASSNDGKSPEYLKAKSKEFPGYTNKEVNEAWDNAVENQNRYSPGKPITVDYHRERLHSLFGER